MGTENKRTDQPPTVDRLSLLWRRISDHKVAQWSIAYVALAYAIQHGVALTAEAFEWPRAIERISMLLFVLGLPVVITLAWYHGERASRSISRAEFSIISILLVVGSLFFYVFVHPSGQNAAQPGTVREAGVVAARTTAADVHGAISLAVLPFLDLSPAKDQEFFSDGMTEEITTALAKVPDLRVVGRTSAFQFKGTNKDLRTIGQALSATHLIEGSVRKAGNRLRITAQLIKADDGTHIWAEDYDRDLTDVFAVQEDIARSITASLHMTLGLKPGENLVNQRTKDATVYDEYLRAKTLVRGNLPEAIRQLNDVVTRDPNYAPAWGVLARAYNLALLGHSAVLRGDFTEAKSILADYGAKSAAAAEKAFRLDPNNSDAVYGYSDTMRDVRPSRIALLERALALDPDNPEPLQSYSYALGALGFLKEAVKAREQVVAIEPFVQPYAMGLARLKLADGQIEDAIGATKDVALGAGPLILAQAYAAQGRFNDAADALAKWRVPDAKAQELVRTAVRMLRGAPAPAAADDRPELGVLEWIYIYRGVPERLAQHYDALVRAELPIGQLEGFQFSPAYAAMRKTTVFKQYIRDSGTLAYWKAKGWPQWCHPTTGDDFACE